MRGEGSMRTMGKRRVVIIAIALLGAIASPTMIRWMAEGNRAGATHVSSDSLSYARCNRVFPDPHAFWPSPIQLPGRSPFAKGHSSCQSDDFMQYQEMIDGSTFMESLFPDFVELYQLERDFGDGSDCATSTSSQDLCSAGLPRQGATSGRVRSDLYMLRVTDERVPDTNKKFFVFLLSIHGIERAGAEGGIRAAEDLATWGYCEATARAHTVSPPAGGVEIPCGREGKIPHPIMETDDGSFTAGGVLEKTAIYFVFANPDGWRRGDKDNLARFYQRYNGNGVDLNRDAPSYGYVERRYTPWSEPESRGIGKVLKSIRPKWDGAIDLHGQLIDRAFSFTMLAQGPSDYGKNQRILQLTKGAWKDAEQRLGWSPLIIPNDQPQNCENAFLGTVCDRMYGVQWGTVWDTIAYTTTGAQGDWMGFDDLGLGADALDNEMSFSHLSNCGTGSCYEPSIEQLHIDGNKSLIYGMLNYTLLPEDQSFKVPGKVGYVYNPKRIKNSGTSSTPPPAAGLSPQPPILNATLNSTNDFTHTFTVLGPSQNYYNGGLEGKATPLAELGGMSGSSFTTSIVLEQLSADEADPGNDEGCGQGNDGWSEVNRYYNQSPIYLQSGQAVHANGPSPGQYRICIAGDFTKTGGSGVSWDLDITFTTEKAWEDPGQAPYDVSNMDFFRDLAKYMKPGQLDAISVDEVLGGKTDLTKFTSIVIADEPFPGYVEPLRTGPAQPSIVHEPPSKTATTAPCLYEPGYGGIFLDECAADYEFDVLSEFNNQAVKIVLDYGSGDRWALEVEVRVEGGGYRRVGFSDNFSGHDEVVIRQPDPGHYRARIFNAGGGQQPSKLQILFSNIYDGPTLSPSLRDSKDLAKWTSSIRSFVEKGGNLVLTDGALKDLAYMGLAPRSAVSQFNGYAGFIQFTKDGSESTYVDPLAAELNQPGAAEGPGYRHQTYEPVPIGIKLPDDTDPFFGFAPIWTIDKTAWTKAGGRTVGITGPGRVSLGELSLGAGRVRILGALLPMPTEDHYHPFGLASYSVTYSGYQLLLNALQWPEVRGGTLAATGPASIQLLGMLTLILGLYVLGRVRSRRATPRATRTPPNVPPKSALVRERSINARRAPETG